MNKPHDYLFKVVLVGDANVGKSSMLRRFVDNNFETSHMATIGTDIKIRTIELEGKVVKLHLWDTAGEERFRALSTTFYRGAQGFIVVYDLTKKASFDHLAFWLNEIRNHAGQEGVKLLLVGNKCDLADQRAVPTATAQELADHIGVPFLETSARDASNIQEAFRNLAAEIKRDFIVEPAAATGANSGTVDIQQIQTVSTSGYCCTYF